MTETAYQRGYKDGYFRSGNGPFNIYLFNTRLDKIAYVVGWDMGFAISSREEKLMTQEKMCPNHKPIQHRDGKPPWCRECGLTANGTVPKSRIPELNDSDVYISPSNDWMQTFTGKAFYPLNVVKEDIDIKDIAHSLSMQCRYNGHVNRFYSVAEHCVLMSYSVPEEDALWALLHDATEAYVGDLIRPVKKHLPEFIRVEDRIMAAIADVFGLSSHEMPESVKEADNRIIENERRALLKQEPLPWTVHGDPLPGVIIECWYPQEAEDQYLNRFYELLDLRGEKHDRLG